MKILFVSHDTSRTGAPIFFLNLIKWISANTDFSFKIIVKYDGVLKDKYSRLAKTYVWNRTDRTNIFAKIITQVFNSYYFKKVRSFLMKTKSFDIIYINSVPGIDVINELILQKYPKIILHIHELGFTIREYYGSNSFNRFNKNVTQFIACSNAVRSDLIEDYNIPDDKISVVSEFIEPNEMVVPKESQSPINLDGNSFVVGLVATAHWQKGFDLLPRLAKKTCEIDDRIHFVWVGADTSSLFARQMIFETEQLGVSNNVHIIPNVQNPFIYYLYFDIFVLLSRREAFSLACLESAYFGKPVLCFEKSGGAPEYIEKNKMGEVIPFLDLDKLAERINYYSKNKRELNLLGESAKKSSENFYSNKVVPQVLSIINKVSVGNYA